MTQILPDKLRELADTAAVPDNPVSVAMRQAADRIEALESESFVVDSVAETARLTLERDRAEARAARYREALQDLTETSNCSTEDHYPWKCADAPEEKKASSEYPCPWCRASKALVTHPHTNSVYLLCGSCVYSPPCCLAANDAEIAEIKAEVESEVFCKLREKLRLAEAEDNALRRRALTAELERDEARRERDKHVETLSIDPDIHAAIKDLQSTSDWVNNACRMRVETDNKKKKKGKKG